MFCVLLNIFEALFWDTVRLFGMSLILQRLTFKLGWGESEQPLIQPNLAPLPRQFLSGDSALCLCVSMSFHSAR